MDKFFEMLGEARKNPDDWKFDHKFHDYVCDYAEKRFNKGYEMGKRHGAEGKVKPLNDERLIKAIEEGLKT